MTTISNKTATVKPGKSGKVNHEAGYADTSALTFSQPSLQTKIQQQAPSASQTVLTWGKIALLGFIINFIIILALL